MKQTTTNVPNRADTQPGVDAYIAAGHDPETATTLDALDREVAEMQAHNQRVLARMTPKGRRQFAIYLRTGAVPTRPPLRTAPRSRGSGRPRVRRSALRSSARSGDSGDEPGEGPEAPGEVWAVTWLDRLPVVWRLRDLRCRLLEIREGVDR